MNREIHLICNAHIDPIWQWDFPEGVSAVISTFASAVKLAEKHDYIFCHNEVTVYKYIEEYAPGLFEKIRAQVKAGRWHIMGGWYLQPDANMPLGESFVRQILEGRRYFEEKFGARPTTAINFDPFGHSCGLVQIIKKCGQDSYLFMRPYPSELKLPAEQFLWRGPDGSEIKAARTGPYNSPLGRSVEAIRERAKQKAGEGEVSFVLWGVGNHGGGPSEKDLSDIERELLPDKEVHYLHSTPEDFFRKVSPTAVFDRSLRISMPGCYTTMHAIKSRHAALEDGLYFAEKICSVAYAKGLLGKYPEGQLRTACEDLLNAEFHDILPGTSVRCGEEEGLRLLRHGQLEAERAAIRAYFALVGEQEPAREGEYPIVVFNPQPYRLEENIECEFMLADQNWSEERTAHISLYNEAGEKVPFQVIKEESNLNLDWRKRIAFRASLAPLALTRYRVFVEFLPGEKKTPEENFVYDDGRRRVVIDRESGCLSSFCVDGVEYLGEGFGLCSFDDNADPWAMGAHQQSRLGENERKFDLSANPCGVFRGMKSIQVIEDGEIFLGVEAFFEQGQTRARVGYKIYKNTPDVDIDVSLFLGETDRIYKWKIPLAGEGRLIGQTAFATEELFTDGRENVAGRFLAWERDGRALAVYNRGVYGSHFENGALYLSLVRGATYCAHPIAERELLPTDRFTKKIDQGQNDFSFRLRLTDRARLERGAIEWNQPPLALNVFPVKEDRPAKDFSVEIDGGAIALEAMKKADGREAILLRLLNNTAESERCTVRAAGASLPLTFGRYEVKTLIYEDGRLTELSELAI